MSKPKPEKQKMATITEVYNRIVWDTRLNRNMFIAGFHERIADGIREKPLAQWDDNSDIPWHRVRYIRCGDVIVWDREDRIDLISTDRLPTDAWKLDPDRSSQADLAALITNNQAEFKPRSVYHIRDDKWQEFTGKIESIDLNNLTVVSYNILSNLHEADKIDTHKRLPVILIELHQTNADIIALQEVTPASIAFILATDWVRSYFISESVSGNCVKLYGNVILSRLPFELVEHQFSGHKRVLVGKWQINDRAVHLANVHLTSDRGENALQKRIQQLATVIGYLEDKAGDCLIVGDFNTRANEQDEIVEYGNFSDLWKQVHPDKAGYTFDPERNPLAMLMSLAGKPARFDRILLRQEPVANYQPDSVELFGCEPVENTNGKIFPSDHFGIRGVLKISTPDLSAVQRVSEKHRSESPQPPLERGAKSLSKGDLAARAAEVSSAKKRLPPVGFPDAKRETRQRDKTGGLTTYARLAVCDSNRTNNIDLTTIRPVYESILAIIPPEDLFPPIQAIRQQYDAGFVRIVPHITLLYGFLPDEYFEEVVELIAPILAKIPPFTVTLADFHIFTHRKTATAWLRPIVTPEGALHELQATLNSLFPQCYEQSTKTAAGFTPHLSVGQFDTPAQARAKLPQWHPVKFTVDAVSLISRRQDEPCVTRHLVGLGKILPQANQGGELTEIVARLEPELTPAERLQRETVLAIVTQACTECLGFEASLHLLGSARLGVATSHSDLDVVCLIPDYVAGKRFLGKVEACLQGLCARSQLVVDARFPVLRLQIEGICLDLLYTQVEVIDGWEKLPIQALAPQIKNPKVIIGCWDADLIIDSVKQNISIELFRSLLKAVRAWAKSRGVYGNSWGFLGGFSWSLLCAYACINYRGKERSIESLLTHFFQLLSDRNWSEPVALTKAGLAYEAHTPRDWLPIVSSIEPCKNTARNVTRSTAQILQNEFARGAEITARIIADKSDWSSLYEPIDLPEKFDTVLTISMTSPDRDALEKCLGIWEGCTIGLIIQLEQIDLFVHPSTQVKCSENTRSIEYFINYNSSDRIHDLERIAQDFINGLIGVDESIEFNLLLKNGRLVE